GSLHEIRFRGSQVSLCFVREKGNCVNRLARADNVNLRLSALFVHQPELHHGGHVQGGHEALKGHFKFFGRVAALLYLSIQVLRGVTICLCLRLLFFSGRRRGNCLGGACLLIFYGRRRHGRLRCYFFLLCFRSHFSILRK